MLGLTLYGSFGGAVLCALLPPSQAHRARSVALLTALAGLVLAVAGAVEQTPKLAIWTDCAWIPSLGIRYQLGSDGISLALVVLTGIAAVAGVLFSWNVGKDPRAFFALYLALIGGVYGVFLSFDLFLLFVFYEFTIVPKYFLISRWGSTRKEYGAMKLALYSIVGGAMVLVGMVALHAASGGRTMSLVDLARQGFPERFQVWVFPLMFVGFGVLAGLWPLHSWAPTGHVAAPTAASMLLAGVVMKLGAYGALRVAITLFPLGAKAWQGPLAVLAAVGIVYGATVALTQKDFKFVIGYSSVSHMGFVLLGLLTLTPVGWSGAVLQMVSHGVIAGLLFAVVGRMVYDRTHTRDLEALSGLGLARSLPFAAGTFTVAAVASMGLPGFSGFVAEIHVILGAWQAFPALALVSGAGILVGVAYTWRALRLAFFADTTPGGSGPGPAIDPITVPERVGAFLLIGASLLLGLYPRLLLEWIGPALDSPMFDGLRKAAAL